MLSIIGRDHVITKCTLSASDHRVPYGWTVRLLVLSQRDGKGTPYWPLFDYFIAHWTKSDAWQVCVARALGSLWDYCNAYVPHEDAGQPLYWRHIELIRGFGQALVNGTIRSSTDQLGLFWMAQPIQTAKRLVYAIENFVEWLAREAGRRNSRTASKREMWIESRMIESVRSAKRQGFSLLGHLKPVEPRRPSIVAFPTLGRQDSTSISAPISFPANKVEEVLWQGFQRPGVKGFERYDLRGMMIFLLQCFAGLREHEPFHLWVNDVCEDPLNPGRACVFLYHPSEGLAYLDSLSGRPMRTSRKEKLEKEYGLPARTHGTGAYRIGWKNSKVEAADHYAVLYWTDPTAAVLFLVLFRAYIVRRSHIMARRRALGYRDHPFLFVSEREDRNSPDGSKFIGAPASIESYESALERAVTSCNLPYGKSYGTTSHGPRHLYASTLRKLHVPGKTLQEGLRHRSPSSSNRYGIPSPHDINKEINKAMKENRHNLPEGLTLARSLEWIELNHPEYAQALL